MLALAAAGASACWTTPNVDLGPSPPGVIVEARLHYYDVTAGTLSEIRRALAVEGPRSGGRAWAAVTSWRLNWTYQYVRGNLGCEIHHVKVRVITAITFPRWNPTSQPDSALAALWYQYNAGLAEHERGHAQLAVQSAGEIVQQLEGMSGGLCNALDTSANAVGQRVMAVMRTKQLEYDQTTRHGATQITQATRLQAP